jgi:hypothetical protein
LTIHSSHWQCQGFISLSDYEEVSSDVRLEHALGSLLGACHLPVAEVTQWREQIRAQAPDIMAAVAYMKERWVALTNSSLARCDKTVPTMPPGGRTATHQSERPELLRPAGGDLDSKPRGTGRQHAANPLANPPETRA